MSDEHIKLHKGHNFTSKEQAAEMKRIIDGANHPRVKNTYATYDTARNMYCVSIDYGGMWGRHFIYKPQDWYYWLEKYPLPAKETQ